MTTNHLAEAEIQQFVIEPALCSEFAAQHMAACPACQANAALYAQLFSAVQEQPRPAFNFDISGLVLQQLPKAKPAFSLSPVWISLLAAIALAVPGWLFRKYLLAIFNGILPMTICLVIVVPVAIVLFQGIDLYRKYQKLINAVHE